MTPAWTEAFREHEMTIDAFEACLRRVPADAWHRPTAPGKWSPASVALHVARAYEYGHEALTRRTAMRMRVPALQAWLLRTFVLPFLLATGRFPEGVTAPDEVVPDDDESATLSVDQAIARIRHAADAAAAALVGIADGRGAPDITHAYLGRLPALKASRFVSVHTRHHMRALDRRFVR